MDPIFAWVESSALSIWARESTSVFAFPTFLSVHALGMACVVGTNTAVSLRLLGAASRVPLTEMRRFFPLVWLGVWLAVASGVILVNLSTGLMFMLTEADQYIFSSAFHLKMLFMGLAGCNVAMLYARVFRRVQPVRAGGDVPRLAKFAGGASLLLWVSVMVCGGLLTFYRPYLCDPDPGFLLNCLPYGEDGVAGDVTLPDRVSTRRPLEPDAIPW